MLRRHKAESEAVAAELAQLRAEVADLRAERDRIRQKLQLANSERHSRVAERAKQYQAAIEEMADGYWEADLSGVFTIWNTRMFELCGRSGDEPPRSIRSACSDNTGRRRWADVLDEVIRTGEPAREIIEEIILPSGAAALIESTVWLSRDGDGNPAGFRAISRDVTRRVRLQEEVQQSDARYRAIIEQMPDSYWETDLAGNYTFFNEQLLQAHRRTRKEMMGKSCGAYADEETVRRLTRALNHVFFTGEPEKGLSLRLTRGDGTIYDIESNICLMSDSAGQAIGFRGTSRDVTKRKVVEEKLRQSEQRYRTVVEEMADSFWELDLQGHFQFFNKRTLIEQRRTPDELLALNNSTNRRHVDEQNLHKFLETLRQVYTTGQPVRGMTFEMIRGDETRYDIECSISLITDAAGNPTGFRGISRDVTERVRQERELQRAKEAAEAASRAKSDFLAKVSHEIRTPMNGIIGMTELALDTGLTADQQEYLQAVKVCSNNLLTLINDILDFSKIEAGKITLEAMEFELRDNVAAVIKLLAVRADQKGLILESQIPPDIPDLLIGDSLRLGQILLNLIGNAIKFTSRGAVKLAITLDNKDRDLAAGAITLHFSVTDTGIGIPVEKQSQVFEAFAQADDSTTRRYGGTGLGLAICSKLVEMMGGSLWLDSTPGAGSVFHFTAKFEVAANEQRRCLSSVVASTPAAAAPANASPAAEAVTNPASPVAPLSPTLSNSKTPREILAPQPGSTPPEGMPGTGRPEVLRIVESPETPDIAKPNPRPGQMREGGDYRILLAEDNVINQKIANRMLEKQHHQVTVVGDGEQAVEAFRKQTFDLILMDVQMPNLNGYEATAAIRDIEAPLGRHIPIIALTAHAMKGDRERCMEAGMDGYLSKPIDAKTLSETINLIMAANEHNYAGQESNSGKDPKQRKNRIRTG
ncbi:MAG TPA: PAS domain S-box protein [Blastocatellia bacterium]|nr:PAS domain S-box protein [Blastocatellia bacterium]